MAREHLQHDYCTTPCVPWCYEIITDLCLDPQVTWAMEVLKLGLSVLWMDMDIYFHASPFNFFTSLLSDADFIIQTELWDHTHSFRGERGNGYNDGVSGI